MYNIKDKFLYEVLDDFKCAKNSNLKDDIFNVFMKYIWSSNNKRYTYTKYLSFNILPDLKNTDIGKIFCDYCSVPYTAYKAITKNKTYDDLIRQKINNLYTNMCDSEVCIKKDYMDLLNTPKKLYYRWQSGSENYNSDEFRQILDDSLLQAEELKIKYGKQKMDISWNDYKKLIEGFFVKMFNNYIPLEEYEDKSKIVLDIDIWTEDNFIISYFCKSLNGYMKNYQKEFYGLSRNRDSKLIRCNECGKLIEKNSNHQKYCNICRLHNDLEKTKNRVKKYRNK
jgi:hypothetical protein